MIDFLSAIPLVGPSLGYVLPFLLVLSVVVAAHEYGHYIIARWRGVDSESFSLGFGRELVGWTDRRGTRWKICALPLGGYVKFIGDADAASATTDGAAMAAMSAERRARSFPAASVLSRSLIVAAGPAFSFLLGIALFAGIAFWRGIPGDSPVVGAAPAVSAAYKAGLRPGDRLISFGGAPIDKFSTFLDLLYDAKGETKPLALIRDGQETTIPFSYVRRPILTGVASGSAAEAAGLRKGDEIISIDGAPLVTFDELSMKVKEAGERPVLLQVKRGEETLSLSMTPHLREIRNPTTGELEKRPVIGVASMTFFEASPAFEPQGLGASLKKGVADTAWIAVSSLTGLWDLIAGRADSKDLAGPLGIAHLSGEAAQRGWSALVYAAALISVSIGLLNLFPIPILDGGRLVFYAIEAARGKPLSDRVQEIGAGLGVGLVLLLMVFATFNDIMRFFA